VTLVKKFQALKDILLLILKVFLMEYLLQQQINRSSRCVKRSELHKFAVIPQRWVVERSFAWLEKCRRLWKNCEKHLNTSLQFINLAFLRLLLHRKYSG